MQAEAERGGTNKNKSMWNQLYSFGLSVLMDGKGVYILSGLVRFIYMSLQYLPEC